MHYAVAGMQGIGKTHVLMLLATLITDLYPTMVVIYVHMGMRRPRLVDLIMKACELRGKPLKGIDVNKVSISSILGDAKAQHNLHIMLIVDEIQLLYEVATTPWLEHRQESIVRDMMMWIGSNDHFLLVVGSAMSMLDCLTSNTRFGLRLMASTKLQSIHLGPILELKEFQEAITKFGSTKLKQMDIRESFELTG
jgi:hypothetical protein